MTLVVDELPSPRDRVEASEDWDRSSVLGLPAEAINGETGATTTPQTVPHVNSSDAHQDQQEGESSRRGVVPKPSIAELLSLHAVNGNEARFSAEEANRVEEVLRQWVRRLSSAFLSLRYTRVRVSSFSHVPLFSRSTRNHLPMKGRTTSFTHFLRTTRPCAPVGCYHPVAISIPSTVDAKTGSAHSHQA
jgi:hypothetical protein